MKCAAMFAGALASAMLANAAVAASVVPDENSDPAAAVDPLIGTRNGGNTFPGAVVPFGMLQWSPENSKGNHLKTAAPGGYQYDATRIRGFSLTHLSGTGCAGASGDIPFMPIVGDVSTAPTQDANDSVYASAFTHANEQAKPGYYRVRLDNGVTVELTATVRSGAARLQWPADKAGSLLLRTSDSEVGSSDAEIHVDAAHRRVSGSVTSGNFCGYLGSEVRHSYYTLYFTAEFDTPFSAGGGWHDAAVDRGATTARGGTGWDDKGYPVAGKGSGAWIVFPASDKPVGVRVGISYVSADNAAANLQAEIPAGTSFDALAQRAHAAWRDALGRIAISSGDAARRTTFYTALYHALLHPNVFSDVDGRYAGFDGQVHKVAAPQAAQYANFSGWDVYRSQLQLVTLLRPDIGADIAQSLLNQAEQNHGEWDRWTHNQGGTHVMSGDPAAPSIAAIYAFGGTRFAARKALASLLAAATVPTAHDLSNAGCETSCVGQRPSLDQWVSLHYIASESNSWAGAAETLEDATADFALADFAGRLGDSAHRKQLLARAQNWKNLYNPHATADAGYIQDRAKDGGWPKFDPAAEDGFVEGSAAQYLWMVPFNVRGLFDLLGGDAAANRRLDAFFHTDDGKIAVTKSGGLHAELNNEPSIGFPYLYDFSGRPYATQQLVRVVLDTLWKAAPDGIPGNDDLGEMSSWYVWSALGLYPEIPGRAELVLASPLFAHAVVRRAAGDITIDAPGAPGSVYVHALDVDGKPSRRPWLPESFVAHGGRLAFHLSTEPDRDWGSAPADAPPSFDAAK